MQPRSPASLCWFYFTAFALLGAYLPYFALYAESLGFDGLELGILAAAVPLGKVAFGPLWTYLADRFGSRKGVALLAVISATAVFSLTLRTQEFLVLCGILYAYAALLAPQLPLVEATTLELSDQHGWQYGRIRVWGSLGFIVTALALGPVFDRMPIRHVLHAILLLLVANVAATVALPKTRPRAAAPRERLAPLVFRPGVLLFFACTLLMQASHGAYYGFFSLFMKEAGYDRLTIGLLWSLGVVAEMVTMIGSAWLLRRLGVAAILSGCLLLASLRWLAYGQTTWLPVLLGAQLLHAFSFGAFHVAAVTGTHRLFPASLRASGQSLYSGLTFGAGSILGFLGAGQLWEVWGSGPMFRASAAAALLASLLSLGLWGDVRLREAALRPAAPGAAGGGLEP